MVHTEWEARASSTGETYNGRLRRQVAVWMLAATLLGATRSHAQDALFTLTTQVSGLGQVEVSPATNRFVAGTVATLRAIPEPGFRFVGWAGDAGGEADLVAVTMDGSKLVTASFDLASGPFRQAWAARHDGPVGADDEPLALAVDNSGHALVTGATISTNYGAFSGHWGTSTSKNFSLFKYRPDGGLAWAREWDYDGAEDFGQHVSVDDQGRIAVSGKISGSSRPNFTGTYAYAPDGTRLWWFMRGFGGGANWAAADAGALASTPAGRVYEASSTIEAMGTEYSYLAVFDPAGNGLWSVDLQRAFVKDPLWLYMAPCRSTSLALGADGSSALTGWVAQGESGRDWTVLKCSDTGALWAYTQALPGDQEGRAVALDGEGNVLIAGTETGANGLECVVLRFSPEGAVLWTNRLERAGTGDNLPASIRTDAAGNIYLLATFFNARQDSDLTLLKYSPAGTLLWRVDHDGPGHGNDRAAGLELDSLGSLYVAGSCVSSRGDRDLVTLKYSWGGTLQQEFTFDGSDHGDDEARAVAVDVFGQAYVAGFTTTPNRGRDWVTLKYAPVPEALPPVVVESPRDMWLPNGAPTLFLVQCTGTEPLSYQWSFQGAPTGDNQPALQIPQASLPHEGDYQVVVSNPYGAATSHVARLTVIAPPVLEGPETNVTLKVGDELLLTVQASGRPPMTNQWQLNGTRVWGAVDRTLRIPMVQVSDAGDYRLIVSNADGRATSAVARVTVALPPSITRQPQDLNVDFGATAVFSTTATGGSLSYLWYHNGIALPWATNAQLSLSPADLSLEGSYLVRISNIAGVCDSQVVVLRLAPQVVAPPRTQQVALGGKALFGVAVRGSQPLRCQWQRNGVQIPGATNTWIDLGTVDAADAGTYSVIVTGPGGTVTSPGALLMLDGGVGAPAILGQTRDQDVLLGADVTFAVTVTGQEPLAYQWSLNGTPLAGETGATLVLPQVQVNQAGAYQVTIGNADGTVCSLPVWLTVQTRPVPPQILNQPSDVVTLAGSDVRFEIEASGTAPLAYQWRHDSLPLAQGTARTLLLANVQATDLGAYDVVVANGVGAVTSKVATLSFYVPVEIIRQPANQAAVPGGPAGFTVELSGPGPFTYQWQFNGTDLPGATQPTLAWEAVSWLNAGTYRVTVTHPRGSVTSDPVVLTVLGLNWYAGLSIGGPVGARYRVEYANALGDTNLWIAVTNIVLPASPFLWVDPDSPAATKRFYRAIREP